MIINKIKNYFSNKFKLDKYTLEVLKKSASTSIVKVGGLIISLIVSIFLGRVLGAEGIGVINLANSFTNLLLVITIFGIQNVIVKNVDIAHQSNNWIDIKNILYSSTIFNGILSILVTTVAILSIPFICSEIFTDPSLKTPLYIAFAMIIPQTFSRIYASALNGIKKIWQSSLVQEALSIWIVGICLLILWNLEIKITIDKVAVLYAIGRLIVLFTVVLIWKKSVIYKTKKEIVLKPMLKMALPLVLIAAVSIITSSMDQLMLGWLKGSREVGIYSVASKLSFFMTFFLLVSNSAISPNIAFLFKENKIKEIKILVKKVTFSLTLFAFTVLFLFTFGGNFLLGIWGEEFKEAYWPLIILSVGQLINNVTGCVGVLLIMCGFEKTHGYISLISLLFNIILNYFLIRVYGVMGAAIASSTVIFVENIIKFRLVRLKILNRSI